MVILQLEEQPPLIQAIFTGEVDAVRKLLESKQDVNYQDFEKRSALHAAAFRGDPIITKLLIDHGARVNTKDCKWVTPLHRACYSGSEETVTILLNNSADTCARDRLWQTPLHIAAACNSLECVSYLLDRIQNPNVTDRSGRTALHHAVLNGHNDIVELLISRGCIVNACDKKDCRPMHWAAYKGHIETVEILLQHGADINAKDRNQYTPLHVAAASGAVSVIDVLVENGADVEAQNAYGNTPLHVACLNGHGNLAAELVRYRCDKEARNYKGQTPLHLAAASTHGVHCLNLLVSQNVDINKQSLDGRTPLHMTAIHGRFTRSKTLIDKGATVDCADRNGCTALHIAAHYGHELLSNTLLSYGAQPARKGFEGRTPLHMCCLSGYIECCRIFIKAGVDLNDKDDTGKTPLHCAAYKGAVECVDLLVSSGADFRVTDMVGRTALHYASAQGFFFCVFTLVGIGSPVNQADKEGRTALHLAAAYDIDGRCVNYLIEHKADPKLKDVNGFTPIHYAVAGNNVNALKYLLYAVGNCALSGPDMPLTTPLHIAARNGNTEMLEKLMPYLSDPNVRNEHGCTPLLMAARHGYASCVQMLLRFGAKVSICDIPNGLSPVHHSAKNGHVHCLALLVDNAEDKSIIDLADNLRRTALMLAVSNSHTDCVTTLIKSGADPNIVDGDGHTCLFRAVVTGQHNILQMLLPRSTIVNERDIHGKTALHVAAGCGRLSCVQRILPYMDEQVKESTDRQDCTALHWACYSGSAECVAHFFNEHIFRQMKGNAFSPVHCAASIGAEKCLELLCAQYGPEIVKLKDDRARTPLHVAALHGQCDCAKFLLEQGADVNRQDEDGKTPLISAAFNGQVQIIEILIGNKADVTFSDKNGNTALHIACLRRHSNAALLLLEFITTPEIINMTNNERKTALHLTARNGLVDVTRRLIAKGSSVTAVDANGLTPALCCAPNTNVAQCLAIILASHSAQNTAANGKEPFPVGLGLNYLKTDARTSTSTLKSGENRTLQTDITMLRDPDQFELERMFEIKFRKTDADPSPSSSSSEDDDGSRFFIHYRSQEDILDIGQTRTELASRSSAHELHGSHSDTALTPKPIYSEEDYEKMIKQTVSGDYLSGDASGHLMRAARRKCLKQGRDDSQHQQRAAKLKTQQRHLSENFKSRSAASMLTTFRSDDSNDVVPVCRDLDSDKEIVEATLPKKKSDRATTEKATHGGGGGGAGATPRMNRSPKYTNKRLKQQLIASGVEGDSDTSRCHVCKQSLGSTENDEHNIPLETMQTAIEKVLAQKGCSTNRCLLAFLDESYELNAKNAHYIYHGMLHPKCEPYIAKHLNLSECDVEIVENVTEDGGCIIRKQQHKQIKQHSFKNAASNRIRYDQTVRSGHRSDKNKLYIGGKQHQNQLQNGNSTNNNGLNLKISGDSRCKLTKDDASKIVSSDTRSKTTPSQFHGGRKSKERRLPGVAGSQKGAKYSVVRILPTKLPESNQIQKVQSEKTYGSKIKKNRHFSCADVQQLTETETIEDRVETGCGEQTNINEQSSNAAKESFFPDYLKPFTNFHHLDPLTTVANEESGQGGVTAGHVRCYSTYWCFPEVTESSTSKDSGDPKSSTKQSPSTSVSSPTPNTNSTELSAYKIKSDGALKREKSPLEFVGATSTASNDHEMIFFNEKLTLETTSSDIRGVSESSLTTLVGAPSDVIDVDDEIEELERLRCLDDSRAKYDGGNDDDDGRENEAADAGWDEVRSLERRGGVTDIKSYSSVDEEAEDWRENLEQFFTNTRRQQLLTQDVKETEKIDVEDWKRFSAKNFESKVAAIRFDSSWGTANVDGQLPTKSEDLPQEAVTVEIPAKKRQDKIELHYDNRVISSAISSEYDVHERSDDCVVSPSDTDNCMSVVEKGIEIAIEEPLDDVSMLNDIPTMDGEEHLVKSTILNEHTDSFLEQVQLQKKCDIVGGGSAAAAATSNAAGSYSGPNRMILIRKTDDMSADNFVMKKPIRANEIIRKKKDEKAINWKLYMAHRCLQLSDNMNTEDYVHGSRSSRRREEICCIRKRTALHVQQRNIAKRSNETKADFRRKRSAEIGENMKNSYRYSGLRFEECEDTVNIDDLIAKDKQTSQRVNFVDRVYVVKDEATACGAADDGHKPKIGDEKDENLAEWQAYIEDGSSSSSGNVPNELEAKIIEQVMEEEEEPIKDDDDILSSLKTELVDSPTRTATKSFLEMIDIKDFVRVEAAVTKRCVERNDADSDRRIEVDASEDNSVRVHEIGSVNAEFADIDSELDKLEEELSRDTDVLCDNRPDINAKNAQGQSDSSEEVDIREMYDYDVETDLFENRIEHEGYPPDDVKCCNAIVEEKGKSPEQATRSEQPFHVDDIVLNGPENLPDGCPRDDIPMEDGGKCCFDTANVLDQIVERGFSQSEVADTDTVSRLDCDDNAGWPLEQQKGESSTTSMMEDDVDTVADSGFSHVRVDEASCNYNLQSGDNNSPNLPDDYNDSFSVDSIDGTSPDLSIGRRRSSHGGGESEGIILGDDVEDSKSEEQTTTTTTNSYDRSDYQDADLPDIEDEEITDGVFYDTASESYIVSNINNHTNSIVAVHPDEDSSLMKIEVQKHLEKIISENCFGIISPSHNIVGGGKKNASQKSVHFNIGLDDDEISSATVVPADFRDESKSWASLNTIYHVEKENPQAAAFIESTSDMNCLNRAEFIEKELNEKISLIEGVAASEVAIEKAEGESLDEQNPYGTNATKESYKGSDKNVIVMQVDSHSVSAFNQRFEKILYDCNMEEDESDQIILEVSKESSKETIVSAKTDEMCEEIKMSEKEDYDEICKGVKLTQYVMENNDDPDGDSHRSSVVEDLLTENRSHLEHVRENASASGEMKKTVLISRNVKIDDKDDECMLLQHDVEKAVDGTKKSSKKTFPSVNKLGKKVKKDSNCKIS